MKRDSKDKPEGNDSTIDSSRRVIEGRNRPPKASDKVTQSEQGRTRKPQPQPSPPPPPART